MRKAMLVFALVVAYASAAFAQDIRRVVGAGISPSGYALLETDSTGALLTTGFGVRLAVGNTSIGQVVVMGVDSAGAYHPLLLNADGSLVGVGSSSAAQVNSDWNAVSGVAQILNKPTIPAAQVWPAGGAGIPQYSGASAYDTSYSASNPIPTTFLTLPTATTSVLGLSRVDNSTLTNTAGVYSLALGTSNTWTVAQAFKQINVTPQTITYSATPAITTASSQTITLTGNAVPTITIVSGEHLVMQICQDGTGNRLWTWPATVHGGMTIGTTANTCSQQAFNSFNGTTLVSETLGVTNVAP